MKEMFEGIDKVLKNQLDNTLAPLETIKVINRPYTLTKVRPIHILDMCNLIGSNVVVGGVRRTAEIFLCDEDDWECIFAKYGINGINQEAHQRLIDYIDNYDGIDWLTVAPLLNDKSHLHHRRMSNNSICFTEKPSQEFLHLLFLIMQSEGEPGFINLKAAEYRRRNARGINPCAEVLLDSYGTCNLTTVNIKSFIKFNDDIPTLDFQSLMQAQALSVRAAIRMTCIDLELHKCDFIQKRDRLIGASLTGWKDAVELLNYNADQEKNLMSFLREIAVNTANDYCYALRIPTPLLTTTIKPEGTLSQVAGGVSSGLHSSYAPFYIRRIRINANDPLAKLAVHLGWTVNPEIGTTDLENPTTLVIDFPVASNVKYTRDEQSVEEQLDTYFNFQDFYTEHNSSNTISVKPDEWDKAEEIVFERWDDLIGVTFFPFHGGTYELAPYEEITEEKYNELKSNMKPFDHNLLPLFENNETETIILDECEVGACPIR